MVAIADETRMQMTKTASSRSAPTGGMSLSPKAGVELRLSDWRDPSLRAFANFLVLGSRQEWAAVGDQPLLSQDDGASSPGLTRTPGKSCPRLLRSPLPPQAHHEILGYPARLKT